MFQIITNWLKFCDINSALKTRTGDISSAYRDQPVSSTRPLVSSFTKVEIDIILNLSSA